MEEGDVSFSMRFLWNHGQIPFQTGFTDNFASNEIIVPGITAEEVFASLPDTCIWPTYYDNVDDVYFYHHDGPMLKKDTCFRFKTFAFPFEAQVIDFERPSQGKPGRLAWHGWAEGDADHRLDVVHAWLIEDMPKGRVRILTQESQKGKPAKDLFNTNPDTMNIGHQDWIKGLARTVLESCKK